MLATVQVSLLAWDHLRLAHAAREGARNLAATNDAEAARNAALQAGRLDEDRAIVHIEPDTRMAGSPARFTITYQSPVVVPFLERLIDSFGVNASVSIRMERDP